MRCQPGPPAGYFAPPEVTAVQPREGGLRVIGSAPPRARVELNSPEGDSARSIADGHGVWRVRLPAGAPRLYAISAMLDGRTVHAEGALVTTPGALTPAVTVRAGVAARPLLRSAGAAIATVSRFSRGHHA